MQSWRVSTKKQYNTYLEKWGVFCEGKKKDPLKRDSCLVLEFLTQLYDKQYSFSALNTARSALSTLFYSPAIGEHVLIKRFMRSVFNARPNLPRYSQIWDVSLVLMYLEKLSPGKCLSLLQLSKKLATLIALVTGQRTQTIKSLTLNDLEYTNNAAIFHVKTLLKHDSIYNNKQNRLFTLVAYPNNVKLCVVTYLKQYINRTKSLRNGNQLFVSTQAPHHAVSSSTISRWIKTSLQEAGIDTSVYSAHSTRAASTTAAAKTLDVSVILQAANWTNERTFGRYYQRPVEQEKASTAFGLAVLQRK